MSRSYRKTPIIKYGGFGKVGRKLANKVVRRYLKKHLDLMPQKGSWYKRLYEQYDIYDVISYCTKEDFPDYLTERGILWEAFYYRK